MQAHGFTHGAASPIAGESQEEMQRHRWIRPIRHCDAGIQNIAVRRVTLFHGWMRSWGLAETCIASYRR